MSGFPNIMLCNCTAKFAARKIKGVTCQLPGGLDPMLGGIIDCTYLPNKLSG